jgi:nucleoid-associated protein YgaU
MTQNAKNSGLIRMALMGTAFIALTIVLVVFQPGSPRHAQNSTDPDNIANVTREADPLSTDSVSAEPPPAAPMAVAAPAPLPQVTPSPKTDAPTNMRDMTFSAISNLKSVTTGEAPAPGQPGSLLHSVVQRSIANKTPSSATSPTLTEVEQVRSEPVRMPSTGVYFVRPGDTLLSIAKELYGDTAMSAELFRNNADIMVSPDSLKPGMVLKLPNP